ncbi:MAG: M48 family metallopeptidase [Deltaproteobacteria bacterium]|nr:M48 family metallopeptidase [Deltaproteobacteria bacterium]
MHMKKKILCKQVWVLSLVLLPLMLSACATAPFTGRQQLMLTSVGQENTLGYQAFSQIRQQYKPSQDTKNSEMVQRVGQRIAEAANRPDFRWEFVLFDEDTVNAFCLPGGKVGIFTGILKYTEDEAGMATVISHEVAHAILRHAGERMSQGLLAQLGSVGLGVALAGQSPYVAQAAQQAYGLGTQVGVMLPYSRKQELEADEVGLILMAKAGYDPEAAVGFWERMMAGKKGKGKPPAFLSTHPTDERRINEIRRMLPKIKERYYNPAT